jgi:hypothetical protein
MRLRPPNRSNRSASSSFLICAVRVGCDTYSTVAGCVKLVSFRHRDEGAQLHCFSVRSKDSPGMPAYSACANERFGQETPEFCNPPKLPIDTITSVNHGACVLVETTPVLRRRRRHADEIRGPSGSGRQAGAARRSTHRLCGQEVGRPVLREIRRRRWRPPGLKGDVVIQTTNVLLSGPN